MKKLFYAASVAFVAMLMVSSCDEIEDEINDVLDQELGDDFTTDDLVGVSGQIKSIKFADPSYPDDTEEITFSYDSSDRVSGYIYSWSYINTDDDVVYSSPASTRSEEQVSEIKSIASIFACNRAARRASSTATKATSIAYTGEAKVGFSYSDNAITAVSSYTEYIDGVEDESDELTLSMTLNSSGYITKAEWNGTTTSETGYFDSESGEYVVTESCTGVSYTLEEMEYDNGYISSYAYSYDTVFADNPSYDWTYKTKEDYTYTGDNLTGITNYYYSEQDEVFEQSGSFSTITYGSDSNNSSLDLAAFFQYAEYSETLLLMHPGLYGKTSTTLPTNVDRGWGSSSEMEKVKFVYNYTDGKLTSVDCYWLYTGSDSTDYQYDYTLEIKYY